MNTGLDFQNYPKDVIYKVAFQGYLMFGIRKGCLFVIYQCAVL